MGFINKNLKADTREIEDMPEYLPAGVYEMIITKAKNDISQSGHKNLNFYLKVREDLKNVPALAKTNGKNANRVTFARVWTKLDENKNDTGQYDDQALTNINDAAGLSDADGVTEESFLRACVNKPVKIRVHVNTDTYKGKTTKRNAIFATSRNGGSDWMPTDYPIKGVSKGNDPFANNQGGVDINPDDLAF